VLDFPLAHAGEQNAHEQSAFSGGASIEEAVEVV
jgi:hypothetical protein